MTDGKHTPGPLETLCNVLDETDLMPLRPKDRAYIESALRGAFGLDITTGSREKDRLIAAAPEMLAALGRILNHAEHARDVKGNVIHDADLVHAICFDALAKAERRET